MYKLILVPLDGSKAAERGLHEAIGLAASVGARLSLLHVIDAYPMYSEFSSAAAFQESMQLLRRHGEELLAQAALQAQESGVQMTHQLREALGERAAHVIVEEATSQGCELIVMGTHGRRGLSRLLMGSDAELVLRSSPVPVLLVRDPGSAG
jgi:nucleotide-binding universal stress UspA family protein